MCHPFFFHFLSHDFLKQFISQIGIRYLGPDPPMDVGKGIKRINPMGMRIEIINRDGDGDGESKIRPIVDYCRF